MQLARSRIDGRESGGAPLVIAHGLFGSARNWATLAKRFAETRPIITVDLRNHGESPWDRRMDYLSMAEDLLAVIDAETDGDAVLLGHSMGGKTAMAAALTAPQKLRGLIVADIAPIAYAHSHGSFIDAMRALDLSRIDRRSAADPLLADAIPEPPLRAFILQNLVIDNGRARWRLNLEAIDAAMPALVGWPAELEPSALSARRFDGPTLFHYGGASDYVTDAAAGRIQLLFPQAQLEEMPNAGHWLHAEKPDQFLQTVLDWLSQKGI